MVNNWAESTDSDVYLVPADGSGKMTNITTGMDGYDLEPKYSPDGQWIAFQSMERPGFEAGSQSHHALQTARAVRSTR